MLFTDAEPASGAALVDRVIEVCPAFVPDEVLRRGPTSFVVGGTADLFPVVAKVLVGESPFWRERFAREIEAYRLFGAVAPPFRVPRVFAADGRRWVLVTERVLGRPVASERVPTRDIPTAELAGAFTELRRLNDWNPPVDESWRVNYTARLDRAHRQGLLDDTDRDALQVLLIRSAGSRQFCHGDVALDNVFRVADGFVFLDWGAAGLYLPGFDLALLWVLLGELPGPRLVVEDMVGDGGPQAWAPFLVNLTLLLGRELRAHEHRTDPVGLQRLAGLRAAWSDVRDRLHRTASG